MTKGEGGPKSPNLFEVINGMTPTVVWDLGVLNLFSSCEGVRLAIALPGVLIIFYFKFHYSFSISKPFV